MPVWLDEFVSFKLHAIKSSRGEAAAVPKTNDKGITIQEMRFGQWRRHPESSKTDLHKIFSTRR